MPAEPTTNAPSNPRPGRITLLAVYLFYAAVVFRTLGLEPIRPRLPIYLALELLYLVLFTWFLWRPGRRQVWQHLYFVSQSILVLALLSLRPTFDFIVVLLVLLSFQAALVFPSPAVPKAKLDDIQFPWASLGHTKPLSAR